MVLDLGLIDYIRAYRIQKELVQKKRLGAGEDYILVCEHPAVFTLGRRGKRANLLVTESFLEKKSIPVYDIDRGGDITFHGPGQLVIYPVLDLKKFGKDMHRYLRSLEDLCIRFLAGYSVSSFTIPGKTGVWAGSKKIAFIGVAASNWITYHGMSINIDVDLDYFNMINPCGMPGAEVTSLQEVSRSDILFQDAKSCLIAQLRKMFDKERVWREREPAPVA